MYDSNRKVNRIRILIYERLIWVLISLVHFAIVFRHVISAVNIAGRSPSFYLSIRTHTLCVLTHHTAGVVSVTACVTDRDRRK